MAQTMMSSKEDDDEFHFKSAIYYKIIQNTSQTLKKFLRILFIKINFLSQIASF